MHFVTLGTSVISLISVPLLPAVADAVARSEIGWVTKSYRRITVLSISVAGLICLALATMGKQIFVI